MNKVRRLIILIPLLIGFSLTLVWMLTVAVNVRANPGVIYVDRDAPGPTHDGLSWTTAFTEVQSALAVAISGDEIWVAEGLYYPDQGAEQTDDVITSTFHLTSGVQLYGGFVATETLRTQRDWQAHITVLSGDIDQNDGTDPHGVVTSTANITGNNVYHVIFANGVDSTALLDGFVVTAGDADYSGGGMYNNYSNPALTNVIFSGNKAVYGAAMFNDHSSPSLTNVTFTSNTAEGGGGGICNNYSNMTLTDVTFINNHAGQFGGGIHNGWYNTPSLNNVTFIGNTAGNLGGGLFNQWSSPVLNNVTFYDNHSGQYGGGVFNWWYSSPTLINVTIYGNTAGERGGGMYNQSFSSPTLINVTFSGNSAVYGGGINSYYYSNPTLINVTLSGNTANFGGGLSNTDYSNPSLANTILWGNVTLSDTRPIYNYNSSTPNITYSLIQGSGGSGAGWDLVLGNDGGGNLDADPLLADPDGADGTPGTSDDNLRLRLGSPAIDAGNNNFIGVTADLDGNPRFVDVPTAPDTGFGTPPIVDMGAYEADFTVNIVKTALLSLVEPGQPVNFTLAFSNSGSLTATHIVIRDTLSTFIVGSSFDSSGVIITDTGFTPPYVWAVQDLAAGQGGIITLTGVLTAPLASGIYTNLADISAHTGAWTGTNTVVVTYTVPNLPPYFTSTPVISVTQYTLYTYMVTTADPNSSHGEGLTITASTLPGWLTLIDNCDGTATLSGTPIHADVGDHIVTLQVEDNGSLTATQTFTITVAVTHGVFFVDRDAPGPTHDGLSWTTAFTTVQSALATAVGGDEIWVAEGVYYPDQGTGQTDNVITSTFTLTSGVQLYGGFAATETLRTQRDWSAHLTVLSGDIDQNDITDPHGVVTTTTNITGNNTYHVIYANGVDSTALLDGFVVTAGDADYSGGGMYNNYSNPALANVIFSGNKAVYGAAMYNDYSSPSLTGVTFTSNTADGGGGGICNNYSDMTLTDVTFSNNHAGQYGGGMFNGWYNTPTLNNVTFIGNTSGELGGGLFNQWSGPILTNVTFSNNHAGQYGGGVFNWWGSNPTLINVTISGNTAGERGGGMYNQSYSSPTLINVTFSGNSATYGGGMNSYYYCNPSLINVTLNGNTAEFGGGISNTDNSNPSIVNTILWGNSASGSDDQIYNYNNSMPNIAYSLIQDSGGSGSGWDVALGNDGGGNLDANPRFVDADGADNIPGTADDNLRLRAGSPAIDAGNNNAIGVTTDLDGNPRFVDVPTAPDNGVGTPPIVDMGAYEANYPVNIVKTVLPSLVAPGQPITFTLTFSNGGSITATHVVITDTISTFIVGPSFESSGVVITDTGQTPVYVWTVQDLATDQGGVITITGVLTAPLADGIYTNTTAISAHAGVWVCTNTAIVTFTVPNLPPYFTSIPVITATQDTPYTYTVTTTDPNLIHGEGLTITALTIPGWLTLVDQGNGTATLSGTPTSADVGDHVVILQVEDNNGLVATQTFTITVVATPHWDIFLPIMIRSEP